jgi:uncharacterized protein YutE (UPF0331/DUF86 family)
MRRDLHLTPCRPRFGNKAASIERAVARVREEYGGDDANLFANQTRQDAIILNLQRACESSIDAAMHLVRVRRLGVPQESREAFDLLERANVRWVCQEFCV